MTFLSLILSIPLAAAAQGGGDVELLFQQNGAVSSQLGKAVAAMGDANGDGIDDFMIGSPRESFIHGNWAGSVYVYSGATGAILHSFSGTVAQEWFGSSVSGAGDVDNDGYDDIIIGSGEQGLGNFKQQSTYVYSGASGVLLYSYSTPNGGMNVSDAGDVNADGYDDFIIGAKANLWGSTLPGSAFVYSGFDGTLLYQFDGEGPANSFGNDVACAGDLNGDGHSDLIIGARFASPGGVEQAGSLYIFSGSDGSTLYTYHGETFHGYLGGAVAHAGDIDKDGFDEIFFGNPSDGSVVLFSGATGGLIHRFQGEAYGDYFGGSIAAIGNLNGSQTPNILVGAYSANRTGSMSSGAAYLYRFDPLLHVDHYSVSVSAGGTIALDLDFPDSAAAYGYRILLSGSEPGSMIYGVEIPLTEDLLVHRSYTGIYPFLNHSGMQGVLDANGDATAQIAIGAAELSPSLIGRTIYLAAAASSSGTKPADFSSVAIPIELTP